MLFGILFVSKSIRNEMKSMSYWANEMLVESKITVSPNSSPEDEKRWKKMKKAKQ